VTVELRRPGGELLAARPASAAAGLHRLHWPTRLDTRRRAVSEPATAESAVEASAADAEASGGDEDDGAEDADAGEASPKERRERPYPAQPGEIEVVLVVDGERHAVRTRLLEMPAMPLARVAPALP
jgi:hypothetical protein